MLQAILSIVFVNHYICCLWFWLGAQNDFGGHYGSWLESTPWPQYGPRGTFKDAAWGYQYATSLHWAISQFTPGGIAIHPQNILERMYTIGCLLFGMVIFSSFIANVT